MLTGGGGGGLERVVMGNKRQQRDDAFGFGSVLPAFTCSDGVLLFGLSKRLHPGTGRQLPGYGRRLPNASNANRH